MITIEINGEPIELCDANDFHRVTEEMVKASIELFDDSHELVEAYQDALAILDGLI